MYEIYSKPSEDMKSRYSDFLVGNDKVLAQVKDAHKIYRNMPVRSSCKVCRKPLNFSSPQLLSFEIEYFECQNCGHFCGKYEDEGDFSRLLYLVESGSEYSKRYDSDFDLRVEKIYLPKADFLLDALKNSDSLNPDQISVLDVGSGGGHFLRALEARNILAEGIEVNSSMVDQANQKLTSSKVTQVNIEETASKILNTDATVISMIGVLEHVSSPMEVFENFTSSKAQYLYISVPMLSLAALLQPLNENVFPRHLAAAHTHVFTQKSLDYLLNMFDLTKKAAWWFGSDMMDMFRMLSVIRDQSGSPKIDSLLLNHYLQPILDDLQKVIDKAKLCSELHLVIGK